VTTTFLPIADGTGQGDLVLADNALGSPRTIPLAGTAMSPYAPRLTITPPIGAPGMVVAVEGDGFPPGVTVQLRWVRSPDRPTGPAPLTPVVSVTTDAAGHLPRTFLLVFPGDVLGPRLVQVSGDHPGASASLPFVVVPGTLQPSAGETSGDDPEMVIRR
jgi:hypothetical protein